MKKILMVLLVLLVITGCDKKDVNMNDYDTIFSTFLNNNTSLVNNYSIGYKYYLPNGVKVLESNNYNEKLYYNGYNYYMFVDIVNYYYKNEINYNNNSNLYYSKKLDFNNKSGYVEIEKLDNLYRIKLYYNYTKLEAYVSKDDIGQTLINMCYIVNSIKFNDSVIEMYVGSEDANLSEETYDFYTPRKGGNFINYINQYDEYQSTEEEIDENNIGNEGKE